MKIAYGSDFHLDFCDLTIENAENADVLIIAGDLAAITNKRLYERFIGFINKACRDFKDVIYVLGNHEDYRASYGRARNFLEFHRPENLHILENESVTLGGVKFAGATLWTDQFKGSKQSLARAEGWSDFRFINNFTPKDAMQLHAESKEYLFKANADVVVTHFAPSALSVNEKWAGSPDNGQFYSSLDKEILDSNIKFWVHGHMHDPVDYAMGRTRILANPRGYPSEYPSGGYRLRHFYV